MRWIDRIFGAAFLCALAVPGLMAWDHGQENAARTAAIIRRQPTPAPTWPKSWSAAGRVSERFDDWFNDAWGGRERALRTNARLAKEMFGTSPAANLFFGKRGWVFSGKSKSMESFTGTDPLSEMELEAWRRSLEDRRRWLAARGIDHVVVLVPHKSTIYPELLPRGLDSARGTSRREQFQAWMAERSDLTVLDLAPRLLAKKPDASTEDTTYRDLYSPHGVHWTALGGHAGYGVLADYLAEHHGAPPARALDAYTIGTHEGGGDSWASRMLLDGVIEMANLTLTPREETGVIRKRAPGGTKKDYQYRHPDTGRPRIVMAHDSFGPAVRELLAEHAEVLETRWRGWLEQEVVERVKPDVVIELYSELSLVTRRPFRRPEYLGPEIEAQFNSGETVYRLDATQPLEFEATSALQTVSVEGQAAVIELARNVTAWRLPAPSKDVPSDAELVLELDLSTTKPGTMGIYRSERLDGLPSVGDMVPLAVGPDSGPTLIPLLPTEGAASTWVFMPPSLEKVTVRSVQIRACRSLAEE